MPGAEAVPKLIVRPRARPLKAWEPGMMSAEYEYTLGPPDFETLASEDG